MVALKGKALAAFNVLKKNLLVWMMLLGVFAPLLQAEAASTNIYDYIT